MSTARFRALAAVAAVGLAFAAAPASAARKVVEDDYPAALAAAREKGVPILVDVWAPW